ncbi:MAG: hypothetical protein Q9217_006518 [Psora testacea]
METEKENDVVVVFEDRKCEDEEMGEYESESQVEDEQRPLLLSPLLRLPLEILHIIQRQMDQATFFISLLTCRRFLTAAAFRPLVLHHLRRMPGLGLGLDNLEVDQLLSEFRKRAAASGHAARVLANLQEFEAASGSLMSKSVCTPHDPTPRRSEQTILAVPHRSGIIQLYDLTKHHVRKREELHIRPEDGNPGRIDVLKLAFASGSRDLAVLCRQEDISGWAPQLRAMESRKTSLIYKLLVFHRLYAKQKGYFYSSHEQETRDVVFPRDPVPVGLALASNGTACIAWKHPGMHEKTMVWLIYRHDKLMQSCSYDPSPLMSPLGDPPAIPSHTGREPLIFGMQFAERGKQLDLFEPGRHIQSWYSHVSESREQTHTLVSPNTCLLDLDNDDIWAEVLIGTPFHASHSSEVTVDWDPSPHCSTSYLALGITEHSYGSDHPNVFIMQQEIYKRSQDCDHLLNLEAGRGPVFQWKALALLAGYRQGSSSLGTVMAISPEGTRIAAARWSRVYLWSFDPKSLLQGGLQIYFPPQDYNARKGIGRLRPTILPQSRGVVHSMIWTNEEHLFAITDRGLVKWDLGWMCDGEKEDLSMEYDTWPDYAVCLPAPGTGDPKIPPTLRNTLGEIREFYKHEGAMSAAATGAPARQHILSRPHVESPTNTSTDLTPVIRDQLSHVDERHPRNSLPQNRIDQAGHFVERASTLPSSFSTDGPTLILPQDFVELLKGHLPQDLLLLDLRVFAQYSKSRITGALNLCIPTTLLKRSSYTVQRLSETFSNKKDDKAKFDSWQNTKAVVVYDAASWALSEATSCVNILKKFTKENWQGATYILKGGFDHFAKKFPEQVDGRLSSEIDGSGVKKLSIDPPTATPVAGGCAMPTTRTAANPFFGTIRQNMDLVDGVGQMPITLPSNLDGPALAKVPEWLKNSALPTDEGKTVAARFLAIEKAEQQRMQKALSANVSFGTPNPLSPNNVQVAGIEKGTKNRYKDILPFDHSRVRLQDVPSDGCDYVNASHVKAEGCKRRYIASQAPVPTTFQDFWRVIWEQDVRLIIMLSAESEGGQLKCHPYWLSGEYGPFRLKAVSERKQNLDRKGGIRKSYTSPMRSSTKDTDSSPDVVRRHSSKPSGIINGADFDWNQNANGSSFRNPHGSPHPAPVDPDKPYVTIRKLALSHMNQPFAALREVTQVQYSSWPDFGAPARPAEILGLVDVCNSIIRFDSGDRRPGHTPEAVTQDGEYPIVVHCSAGCGRTGTFCTIDSVIDMLRRQHNYRHNQRKLGHMASTHDRIDSDLPEEEAWLADDSKDLVASTVASFRLQRLSMVQTLRQFVLCYESVLEWVVSEAMNPL